MAGPDHKATRESVKLTDSGVKKLPPGDSLFTLWDGGHADCVKGLGVRVTPNGAKSFVWKYTFNGRQRWMTIGTTQKWSVSAARKHVLTLAQGIDKGIDPASAVEADKKNPTVAEFAKTFLADIETRRKPSTKEGYEIIITKYILKPLGKLLVKDITLAHVEKVFYAIKGTLPTQANRAVAVLSSMLTFAEKQGKRAPGTNPCRAVEKVPENHMTRHLNAEEMGRLLDTLQAQETRYPYQVRLIRLLLLTGARLREINNCRWGETAGGNPLHPYLDLAGGRIVCVDHKSSREKGAKDILLSKAALAVIQSLKPLRLGSPYLFPSPDDRDKPLANPHHAWLTVKPKDGKPRPGIRDLAGLPDVRLHDLRHSFGTLSVTLNQNITLRQKLLGHASSKTTERYSHADLDPLRAAVEQIGEAIEGLRVNKSRKNKNLKP